MAHFNSFYSSLKFINLYGGYFLLNFMSFLKPRKVFDVVINGKVFNFHAPEHKYQFSAILAVILLIFLWFVMSFVYLSH